MKTPVQIDTRGDAIATEHFDQMLGSKAWAHFIGKVKAEWGRACNRCLVETDEIELRRAQGAAAALLSMLSLPRAIQDEMHRQPAPSVKPPR